MKSLSRRNLLRAGLAGGATLTAGALQAAVPAVGPYKAGTYSAKAAGISGDVTVRMTFSTDRITDVVIDASGETPGIGGKAAIELQKRLMATQNAGLDAVSGATVTSDAIARAAQKCIDQAQGKIPVEVISTKKTEAATTPGDWLGKPPVIEEKNIAETIRT